MKAILLAAGKGTRISRRIEQIPKCTLPVNGLPLIRRTINMLQKKSIECSVCVGYERDKIFQALEGLDIKYYFNPFYEITNSIASLWFARDFIDDEILIMNADVYMSEEIMDLMLESSFDNVLAIDTARTEIGDYFFSTTGNGILKKYGKDLPLKERSGEYVGIAKISKQFTEIFKQRMNEMIANNEHQRWWENVLYSFADTRQINTLDIGNRFWAEVDYFDDYERILKHISESE